MARITRTAGPGRAALVAATVQLGDKTGKVGWFESDKYEKGQPVAGIAAVHEFGSTSRGIPPRPYFRPTAAEQAQEWKATAAQVSKAIVQGHIPPGGLMEALCLKAEGDVRATITKLSSPALKASTVQARKDALAKGTLVRKGKTMGIEKPLVASGLMLATLTSKVE